MTNSIQQQISLLESTKAGNRQAIMEKGVMVYASDLYSTYPTRISQISMTPGDKDGLLAALVDKSITSFDIPQGTEVIRPYAFAECNLLASITIPDSVKIIREYAFFNQYQTNSHYSQLTEITIPASVTSIGEYAFYNIDTLTSLTFISETPATLSQHALDTNNCPIYVPVDSVDTYKSAWSTYASRIVAISNSFAMRFTPANGDPVIEVELENLTNEYNIIKSDVPSSILNGTGALEIGEGVKWIDNVNILSDYTYPFRNFTGLTSITFPSSLVSLGGQYGLQGCTSLQQIVINKTTTFSIQNDALLNTNNCPIYVPSGSLQTFRTANIWTFYADRIFEYGVADYRLTNSECELDENQTNTGYLISTYTDMNPSSSTYNQTRTEMTLDETICPVSGDTHKFVEVSNPNDYTSGVYIACYTHGAPFKFWNSSLATTSQTATQGSNASGNYITGLGVSWEDGVQVVPVSTESMAASFTVDLENGTLQASNGLYLYRATSSAAGLLASETAPTTGWKCSFTNVTGSSPGYYLADNLSSPKYFKYNSSNNGIFRWYSATGSQQSIVYFKLI